MNLVFLFLPHKQWKFYKVFRNSTPTGVVVRSGRDIDLVSFKYHVSETAGRIFKNIYLIRFSVIARAFYRCIFPSILDPIREINKSCQACLAKQNGVAPSRISQLLTPSCFASLSCLVSLDALILLVFVGFLDPILKLRISCVYRIAS